MHTIRLMRYFWPKRYFVDLNKSIFHWCTHCIFHAKCYLIQLSVQVILCEFCEVSFPSDRNFLAKQHLQTVKHTQHVRLSEKKVPRRSNCVFLIERQLRSTLNEFNSDMAKVCVSVNILGVSEKFSHSWAKKRCIRHRLSRTWNRHQETKKSY